LEINLELRIDCAGIISDVAASFLSSDSLKSQHLMRSEAAIQSSAKGFPNSQTAMSLSILDVVSVVTKQQRS
jgi:hypothetical protein